MKKQWILIVLILFSLLSCNNTESYSWKPLEVKTSAYNSVAAQTDHEPNIAAWGDTLKPGMKCIAVSRDLIALGLKHNTKVKIAGLSGIYLVKDKMNARYNNRVDIYMGTDVKRAKKWGQKKLKIKYAIEKPPTENAEN
ncbi:3D domain-containing protein [Aurantibacter crassamenti]|uniref:3D domain-containing protein n=1 Tax=Aurantibacter crassamenti TaxID=1837375 RepID=UPI0019399F5A|nr:3D domain-containing protein [Aurantibacter crassamenti]MBM1107103.1 3D domain-containing protein [Aurantibacter crassamenti]